MNKLFENFNCKKPFQLCKLKQYMSKSRKLKYPSMEMLQKISLEKIFLHKCLFVC